MKKLYILLVIFGMVPTGFLIGQTVVLNSNQSPPIIAGAGIDTTLISGQSIVLGANPSAVNGYGSYLYFWTPAVGLDDPTKPNPVASPAVTTTYTLTVTDLKNCSAQDEVTITVSSSGTDPVAQLIDFKLYPNPVGEKLIFDLKGVSGSIILKVINSTGVKVYEVNQNAGSGFLTEMDTRMLPTGNYFVILICNGNVITKPVMIL